MDVILREGNLMQQRSPPSEDDPKAPLMRSVNNALYRLLPYPFVRYRFWVYLHFLPFERELCPQLGTTPSLWGGIQAVYSI